MSELQLLVFDLDGTLVDSSGDIAASINCTRKRRGLPELEIALIRSHLGDGARQLVQRCFPELTGDEVEASLLDFRAHYTEHCTDLTEAYSGVLETLKLLKDRYRMAVLTNKYRAASVIILERLGLLPIFEIVVGGDGPCLKPCPDGLLGIVQSLKLDTKNIVMIGDHHTDLEAGRRAGVKTIFCEYGFGIRGEESPDAVIAQFSDLSSVLPELSGTGSDQFHR
jgi:phosphoglycolate phosphatase